MKFDPFYLLGSFGLTGVVAVQRDGIYALDFMGGIATGGFCALLFSLIKSRRREADGIDTSLWAMIALISSMWLAFFIAPSLAGRSIPYTDIELNSASAAFLVAVIATPVVEWIGTGGALKLALGWIEKRGGAE